MADENQTAEGTAGAASQATSTANRERVRATRPDTSAPAPARSADEGTATISKPESASTEAAKANGGVGEGNDLSKADLKDGGASAGPSADPLGAEGALTGSRGPLSSDTASQLNLTDGDVEAGDERSDAQKYADEKVEEVSRVVTPPRPDGRFPKVNFDMPFGVVATQVVDAAGRVVCYVAQDHLDMAERENIAQFISAKLNVN